MPSAPVRIATCGGSSSHVLDLRADAKLAASGKVLTLPEKFEALRGHNFLPGVVHDWSRRLAARIEESGFGEVFLGSVVLPPLLSIIALFETLARCRFSSLVFPLLPRRAALLAATRFAMVVFAVLLSLKLLFVLPPKVARHIQHFRIRAAAAAAAFEYGRRTVSVLGPTLAALPDRLRLAASLMGQQRLMRYLVVFQNNAELRPAGGFAGSFALVDVDQGKLKRIEIPGGGSYDLQGGLTLRVAAPEPLKRFRSRWEFQDTNWFSDWPSSARTMMAFYENAGGPTVDGALMLTTSALEELLGVLGPLDIPEQRMQLSKENAFITIQSVVESKTARKSKRPKVVLGSIVAALMKRVSAISPAEVERLLPVFEDLIRARHVAIYLKDEQQQQAVLASGLAAEVRENPGGDYLSFVAANIGGGKSDREIEDTLDLATSVTRDGNIERTLRLMRTHHGRPGAPFVGVPNISYVRFYVPRGATLLSAKGFSSEVGLAVGRRQEEGEEDLAVFPLVQERPGVGTVDPESRVRITEEFGKTVFGNWLIIQPGQTAEVRLRYQLPFSLPLTDEVARYTLLVQKQPGTRAQNVNFHFALPSGWSVLSAAPESRFVEEGFRSVPLDRDRTFALLFTRS